MSYLHHLSSRLVALDTVSHRSACGALELLADELDRFGYCVALQHYEREPAVAQANLVAVGGPPVADGLVLSGHVDVVPFADQPGWSCEPLRLDIGPERVRGRGTSDMKLFLAQCVEAARRVDPASLKRPVVLVFTAEEEIGCLGAERLVRAFPTLLGACPLPRLGWIGEPTSGRVFHAHKGIVAFRVEVKGRGGHSSVPEAGVNAIAVAAQAIGFIGEEQARLRAKPHPSFLSLYPDAPYTTLNFGTIEGGTAANMIAEACSFVVSYRPLPDEDPLALYRHVRERMADLDLRDWGSPGGRAEIAVGEAAVAPGLLTRRGTWLEQALFERLGTQQSAGAPFCTDGGQFARAGLESLICGPGDLEQAHQPDESCSRAAFETFADHILAVVTRHCGGRLRD